MARLFANNATATLASGITSSDTTISLSSGSGALYPTPTGGDFFILTLTQPMNETSWEDVKVTGRTGDTLTISERGYGGTTAVSWVAGSKADIRLTADAAQNGANALCPDASGNVYANVVPRTGTLSSLLALAGGVGELSCATDADAIVKHNGVAGQARAFYAGSGGLILYNSTAVTNDTITCSGYGELLLNAASPTALAIVLPQSPTNGQRFVLRVNGAQTAALTLTIWVDTAKTDTLTVVYAAASSAFDITFEYSTPLSAWSIRDASGSKWASQIASDTFSSNTTLPSTALTSGTVLALGSHVITSGSAVVGSQTNYLLVACVNFTLGAGAVLNNAGVCISVVSGDYVTGNANKPKATIQGPIAYSADAIEVTAIARLMSISATATRYINVKANFSGGTCNAAGYAYTVRL